MSHVGRKQPLYTSVDASRPRTRLADNAKRKRLVEPPGIAPGSGPLITSAFIAIVRASPNALNIGRLCSADKAASKDSLRTFAGPVCLLVAEPCQLSFGI